MAIDVEREIRELLAERAGDVRQPAEIPGRMLRRARRRRIGTALGSTVVLAGLVAAAIVGTRALITPTATPNQTRLGGADGEPFAIWPQTTREEAQEVQACVDAGRRECAWQLNALEVVRRYGEQELGWERVFALVRGFNDDFVRLPLQGESEDIGLADVVDPLTVYIAECPAGPNATVRCPIVEVRVEKPIRPDVTGIWVITRSTGPDVLTELRTEGEGPTAIPSMPRALSEFLDAFMTARYRGAGAERFLSEEALALYESRAGGLSLYGYTDRGRPYEVLTWHGTRQDFGVELRIQVTTTLTRHEVLRLKKSNDGTLVIVFARGVRS